ncbi:DUF448 domain-containing protein [Candidatus Gracilibacteria bacterium]|nr:DUF448 domain-containing protein [Candidatus Gracilibacteria bacterium]
MPIRTCFVTGEKKEQSELFRFIICEGKLHFDEKKPAFGRGGYVSKSLEALEKLPKIKGKISHFLKVKDFEIRELEIRYQISKIRDQRRESKEQRTEIREAMSEKREERIEKK